MAMFFKTFILTLLMVTSAHADAISDLQAEVAAETAGKTIPPVATAPVLRIVVRPAVNLDSIEKESAGELTLAELVDDATIPEADRANVMRHLQAITLMDRPGVGEERVFTREGLETIVSEAVRRLETAGYQVEFKLPSRTTITRLNRFDRDQVQNELRQQMARRCDGCEIVFRRIDWPNMTGLEVQSWRLLMRAERPRGNFAVPIELSLRGGSTKTLSISGQLELFSTVLTLNRSVVIGERLNPSDVRSERKNVTYAMDASAKMTDLDSMVAARSLAVGDTVWKNALRREQILRFGDAVKIQVGGESWSITTAGVAQGAAAIGDTVRVKINQSQKFVSGILKEKGLVEVQ